jgi:hypothetical protein
LAVGLNVMPGKRVQFGQETWNALDLLAKDTTRDFQDIADEAFCDLLRKHGRPVDLKTTLRQSVGRPRQAASSAISSASRRLEEGSQGRVRAGRPPWRKP